MDHSHVHNAIRRQLLGGLAMLRQCVEVCPHDRWPGGTPDRPFWRIAYHAVFFAHLYSCPHLDKFVPWEKHVDGAEELWDGPSVAVVYSQQDVLGYIDWLRANVGAILSACDLESNETGFHWYPSMGKLDHLILNVRHLQGHVGQLSEILMAKGIDTDWNSGREPRPE